MCVSFLIWPIRLGQKSFKKIVCFLGNGVSRKIAFEIFWPLGYSEIKELENTRAFKVRMILQKILHPIEPWLDSNLTTLPLMLNTMSWDLIWKKIIIFNLFNVSKRYIRDSNDCPAYSNHSIKCTGRLST